MQATRLKWCVPLFSVAAGLVVFGAQWIGGDPGSGLVSLAILTAFGAVFLFGGRSETIRDCGATAPTSGSARWTSTPPRSPAAQ